MSIAAEPALTVASLVDEIQDALHGYVRVQDQSTSLTADISAGALEFAVDAPSLLSRGAVQIGDELVSVERVDTSTGMVLIAPWGRAQSGSLAAAHVAGSRVTQSPLFPRQRIASAIYGVLREIYPDIYAVGETRLDINPTRTNYELPYDCWHVMHVEWLLPGPTGLWAPAGRWRQNKTAGTVELELLSPAWPGDGRARVRYMRVPPTQVQGTDNLASYGYDQQVRDLIVLGVTARMLTYVESSRVQTQSVESHGRSEAVPAGSAQNLSRYLYQLFRARVEDERKQLLMRWPLQPHRTR